jgi:hypothetical protein
MLFKNLKTGLVWEVEHPDHIERCKNDDDYEEVKPKKVKQSPKKVGE